MANRIFGWRIPTGRICYLRDLVRVLVVPSASAGRTRFSVNVHPDWRAVVFRESALAPEAGADGMTGRRAHIGDRRSPAARGNVQIYDLAKS